MARRVIHAAQGPVEFKTQNGDSVWICRCGLTKSEQGLCDGAHKQTHDEKEGELYEYDGEGRQEEGCCGGGCCH